MWFNQGVHQIAINILPKWSAHLLKKELHPKYFILLTVTFMSGKLQHINWKGKKAQFIWLGVACLGAKIEFPKHLCVHLVNVQRQY